MSDREQIEARIRVELASETSAILLSYKLFAPGGLFPQLAATEEERRVISQTPLFRDALKRIADLRGKGFAQFARSVEQFEAAQPGRGRFSSLNVSIRSSCGSEGGSFWPPRKRRRPPFRPYTALPAPPPPRFFPPPCRP